MFGRSAWIVYPTYTRPPQGPQRPLNDVEDPQAPARPDESVPDTSDAEPTPRGPETVPPPEPVPQDPGGGGGGNDPEAGCPCTCNCQCLDRRETTPGGGPEGGGGGAGGGGSPPGEGTPPGDGGDYRETTGGRAPTTGGGGGGGGGTGNDGRAPWSSVDWHDSFGPPAPNITHAGDVNSDDVNSGDDDDDDGKQRSTSSVQGRIDRDDRGYTPEPQPPTGVIDPNVGAAAAAHLVVNAAVHGGAAGVGPFLPTPDVAEPTVEPPAAGAGMSDKLPPLGGGALGSLAGRGTGAYPPPGGSLGTMASASFDMPQRAARSAQALVGFDAVATMAPTAVPGPDPARRRSPIAGAALAVAPDYVLRMPRLPDPSRQSPAAMIPPWSGGTPHGELSSIGSSVLAGPTLRTSDVAAGFREEPHAADPALLDLRPEQRLRLMAVESESRLPPQSGSEQPLQVGVPQDVDAVEPRYHAATTTHDPGVVVRPDSGPPSPPRAPKASAGREAAAYQAAVRGSHAALKSRIKSQVSGRPGGASGSNSLAGLADTDAALDRNAESRAKAEERGNAAVTAIENFKSSLRDLSASLPPKVAADLNEMLASKDTDPAFIERSHNALVSELEKKGYLSADGAKLLADEWRKAAAATSELEAANEEIRALAEERALTETRRDAEIAKLAKSLGLRLEDVLLALDNPASSISKRIADERARRDKLADDRERRADARSDRLRYGEQRAAADKALAESRIARDRASAASAELSRLAKSATKQDADRTRSALRAASDAAAAAKQAAKDLKRLTQYGTAAQIAAAKERSEALGSLAQSLAAAAEVELNVVRVSSNPHPDAAAQAILLKQAKADAAHATAIAALQVAKANGDDTSALQTAVTDAANAAAAAKVEFDDAVLSGQIGLEYTQYPDCPPSGLKGPPSCACDPKCLPWQVPYYRFSFDPKARGCADVLKSPEEIAAEKAAGALLGGGGKGAGPGGPGPKDGHEYVIPRTEQPPNGPPAQTQPPPPPPPSGGSDTHGAAPEDGPEALDAPPGRRASAGPGGPADAVATGGAPADGANPPNRKEVGPGGAQDAEGGPANADLSPAEEERFIREEIEALAAQIAEEFFAEARRRSRIDYPSGVGRENEDARIRFLSQDRETWAAVLKLSEALIAAGAARDAMRQEQRSRPPSSDAKRREQEIEAAELDLVIAQLQWSALAAAGSSDHTITLRKEGRDLLKAAERVDSLRRGEKGYESGQRVRGVAQDSPHLMVALRMKQGHGEFAGDYAAWEKHKVTFLEAMTGGKDATIAQRVAVGAITVALTVLSGGALAAATAARGAWTTLAIGAALGAAEGAAVNLATQLIVHPQHPIDFGQLRSSAAWGSLGGALGSFFAGSAARRAARVRATRGTTRGAAATTRRTPKLQKQRPRQTADERAPSVMEEAPPQVEMEPAPIGKQRRPPDSRTSEVENGGGADAGGELPSDGVGTRSGGGAAGEVVEHAGYRYTKDGSGRVVRAEGRLRLEEGADYSRRVSEDVRARGAPGDDAGHIIAKRFGADFNLDTAVPQNSNFNRGAYRSMERELATQVGSGKTVDVVVEIEYAAGSTRPSNFTVRADIGGREKVWSFANAPGGR